MKQTTIKRDYNFSGKGLHTGKICNVTLSPAPIDFGIKFLRKDISDEAFVPAFANYVSSSSRNTSLNYNDISIFTPEHLLSALAGLQIDNVLITLDCEELPILDGSAKKYVDAILADGIEEQEKEKNYLVIKEPFVYTEGDAVVEILPSDKFEVEFTIDFKSQVLGVQTATFVGGETDYPSQIALCRTFCFYHEIEALLAMNLIKGGDLDNALVIVEKEPTAESIQKFGELFGFKDVEVKKGYLSYCQPFFDNECARHKLLDLIGDFALIGRPIKGKIIAKKSGHRINTTVAKQLIELYGIEN